MDGGAWWATVHGVTKSRIQLKQPHTEELLNFIFNFSTKGINILDKKRERENNFYELKKSDIKEWQKK